MAKRARKQDQVSFDCPKEERHLCKQIARRASDMLAEQNTTRDVLSIDMDITATHCNGNPLRLADLLAADDFNFMHDVAGIYRHLDRETGSLMDHFSPRFSRRDVEAA